jgi:hypothetical protein
VRGRRRINAEGFRWLEPPYTREEQRLLWKPPLGCKHWLIEQLLVSSRWW